jgi:uncharacterized membrane protein YvlD (DUF360 family)
MSPERIKSIFTNIAKFFYLVSVQIVGWVFVDILVDGVYISGFLPAFKMVLVLTAFSALLWPIVSRITLKISIFTFGLFNFFLVGAFIWFSSEFVAGVRVNNLWSAAMASLVLAACNLVASFFISITDDRLFYKEALKRRVRNEEIKDKSGVVFIEIDGLAKPIMERAINNGYMPFAKYLIEEQNYCFKMWETDYSCQTGASQIGILNGNNTNIPAFRWVDKKTQKIVSSGSSDDTPVIEKAHSNGDGLLVTNGAGRSNMYSGDANDTIFTSSTLKDLTKMYNTAYYGFFSDPYNISRTIMLSIWEIILEFTTLTRQKVTKVEPRLSFKEKKLSYVFVRAATNVVLRDITSYSIIADMFEGKKDAIYATMFGYDELAHHSGTEDIDTLRHLKKIDKEIANLYKISLEADREYEFVILSDHGQSLGATFKQRYGKTLEQLVNLGTDESTETHSILATGEDKSAIASLAETLASTGGKLVSAFAKKLHVSINKNNESETQKNITVLASGNLGLIYFNEFKNRLTLEQINEMHPNLIDTLVNHPGVGFIVLNSKEHGAIVVGKEGKVVVKSKEVIGKNPLTSYRKSALKHIERSTSFTNAPDIFVNSTYYSDGTVAAFEELIGSHGGMGGEQWKPFVLFPSYFDYPKKRVVGAEQLHKVLKSWL